MEYSSKQMKLATMGNGRMTKSMIKESITSQMA